jgi:hypothetical protein
LKVLELLLINCVTLDTVARVCATTTAAEADELGATLRSAPSAGWKTLNTGTIDPFCNHWDSEPIRHQGRSVSRPVIPDGPLVSNNRRKLYSSPKLIFAKMALRLEGFVDREGEYAALNCNCASAPTGGWTIDSLAVVLHSTVIAFAYRQYFDGLRMSGGYLPYQAPQLRIIPVPKINKTIAARLDILGRLRALATNPQIDNIVRAFLADLSDACVMECYFRDHMAERDLLFLDDLAGPLSAYDLTEMYRNLNAPASKIRNRLVRLTADSPDLLAVIKEEGKG